MTREERLTATFVELADSLVADFDVVDLMILLTERCVEILGASSAGLLLADPSGDLTLVAATDDALRSVELFQLQSDEGPCRDCFHTGAPVSTLDLADADDRWPRFAPVAARAGFRATNAFPLRLRGQVLGALNLFRTEPSALSPPDVIAAQALADVASIALVQSRALVDAHILTDQLQHALDSRVTIEQAKGVLAERFGCSVDQAFSRMRRFARENQLQLATLASGIVDGSFPAERILTLPPR